MTDGTHTGNCHSACPGHVQPPHMDGETWVLHPCICSCHYPLTPQT